MNLKSIYEFQKEHEDVLQNRIEVQGKVLLSQKILSLQVKLGELANETQCFKFWMAKKSPIDRKVIEKYLETLYTIFSIGIEKGFTETEFTIKQVDAELTEHFLNLFIDLNDFLVCSTKDQYITLIEDVVSLSLLLGFNEHDILDTHKKVYSA